MVPNICSIMCIIFISNVFRFGALLSLYGGMYGRTQLPKKGYRVYRARESTLLNVALKS